MVRVHRLGSLCAGCAHSLPSPPAPLPLRGRGEPRVLPLSREVGEGDTGGEGNTARLPVHAHAWKTAPAAAILCRTDVPLSGSEGEVSYLP